MSEPKITLKLKPRTTRSPCQGLTTRSPCRGLTTHSPCRGLTTRSPCRGLTTRSPCRGLTTRSPCRGLTTRVCNVSKKYIKPLNLKEWCENSDNVYIGRGNVIRNIKDWKHEGSMYYNPYKTVKVRDKTTNEEIEYIGMVKSRNATVCTLIKRKDYPSEVVDLYRKYVLSSQTLMENLETLRNKNLGCWCVGEQEYCHGLVLKELLDNING